MMRARFAVLLAVTCIPLSKVRAQRVADGLGRGPGIHRDSTRRPSREALFVERGVRALGTGLVVAAPFAIGAAYRDADRKSLAVAGALAYLGTTSYVAARLGGSNRCRGTARMLLAFGGALTGAVSGHFVAAQAYPSSHPDDMSHSRPATLASVLLGMPFGAAAALYNCN